MSTELPEKQEEKRNEKGQFVPGVSGNPAGRPKGKTMKEFARDFYLNLSDEEKVAYIKEVEKKRPGFAWEMAEGKAHQHTDVTSKGEKIVVMPAELIAKNAINPTSGTESDSA